MAKLEKKPNAIIEKSSMGINMVERARAPTDTVKPMETAVTMRPMMMGPERVMNEWGKSVWEVHVPQHFDP